MIKKLNISTQITFLSKNVIKEIGKNNLTGINRMWDELNEAISRRLKVVEIREPLFIQNNIYKYLLFK